MAVNVIGWPSVDGFGAPVSAIAVEAGRAPT